MEIYFYTRMGRFVRELNFTNYPTKYSKTVKFNKDKSALI